MEYLLSLQFVEKFSEAREAARKAIEERKHGGNKSEGTEKTASSLPPELKSPPHQSTPVSPPSSAEEERKREEGAGKVMVNGDSSAGKVTSTSSAEVNQH